MRKREGNDSNIGAMAVIVAAIIGLIGAVWAAREPMRMSIQATQTAEDRSMTLVPHVDNGVCGKVDSVSFVGRENRQNNNNGIWRVIFVQSNPNCWYKIVEAALTSGIEVDQSPGAGPFRAGQEPNADFPCSKDRFEVWAIRDGDPPDRWSLVGGPFIISPDFCSSIDMTLGNVGSVGDRIVQQLW